VTSPVNPVAAGQRVVPPLPLLKLQMLGRRNIAYGTLGLFTFLVISQSGSTVPMRYLQEFRDTGRCNPT